MYSVEEVSGSVHTIRMDKVKAGWEQWFLLRSDAHHDSVYCNQELEKKHLDMAVDRGAGIIDAGDLFDAMQGKKDNRHSRDELRNEFASKEEYFDALVEYNADFYRPYAKNICVLGMGNHETSVLRHSQTNLTKRLASELRRDGERVFTSGYNGWIRFRFTINKTKNKSFTLYYDHGKGGNSPVTRGVIQTNRMAVYLPDADIVLTGHSHDAYDVPIKRISLNKSDFVVPVIQRHIKTPTYKDPWLMGAEYGFDTEKGSPKPVGCYWLRFFFDRDELVKYEITADIT